MPTTLRVNDETTSGHKTNTLTLAGLADRLSVRELIRARINQEVSEFNQREPDCFCGLVAPVEAERTDHGYRLRHRRKIDGEQQLARALEAFQHKGFCVLINDQLAQGLDEEIEVKGDTEVAFVKLAPLVGG